MQERNSEELEYLEAHEISEILTRWKEARPDVLSGVFQANYKGLKNLAKKARKNLHRSDQGDTYNTTALVHEMYPRLMKGSAAGFESSRKFYQYFLQGMEFLLKDHYHKKSSKKNETQLSDELQVMLESGQGKQKSPFSNSEGDLQTCKKLELIIYIGEIIKSLESHNPIEMHVIKLKYWFDKTDNEIAEELDISPSKARTFLRIGKTLIRLELDEQELDLTALLRTDLEN
jgi:RNA polymerase sigma factor (sigma-70 family)